MLVFGRLPVLADEAAAVEGVEGEGDFADFGGEVWRIRMGWRYVSGDEWIVGGGLDHRVGQFRWVGLRTFQMLLYSKAHLPGVIAADEKRDV